MENHTVKILIGNVHSKIIGFIPDEVHEELHEVLSYRVAGAEHIQKVKDGKWDGYHRLYMKSKGQSFYSGLIAYVVDVLKKHNIKFVISDMRIKPEQNMPNLKFMNPEGYETREYQEFTVKRCMEKSRGVLKIATGGGKTQIASKLISEIKTGPFMFYVLTMDLMDQAYETFSQNLNVPIGRIGGGHFDIQDINICTIQTAVIAINSDNKNFKISDYLFDEEDKDSWKSEQIQSEEKLVQLRKLISSTKGLIVDESHHVGAKTVNDVLTASPNAYWRFGCSATPYREDNAEIMIQAMFGQKIVDISASYLINKGFLVTPYIFFVPVHDNCYLHSYKSIYSQCVVKNEKFNASVASTANFLASNNLSVLIMVQQYVQGDYLKKLIPNSVFITSRMSKKERRESLNRLRRREVMVAIVSSLGDEGLDVPSLDSAILAGGGASSTRIHQRIGRTLRINRNSPKETSIVIIYDHDSKYLHKHTVKVKGLLKTEEAFILLKSNGLDYINNEVTMVFKKKDEDSIFKS